MCCCCPPAINALLCLWCRSGCSKASVAGALTFFPPEPPLYKFKRTTPDGTVLPDVHDDIEVDGDESDYESSSELDEDQLDISHAGDGAAAGTPGGDDRNSAKKKKASSSLSERSKMLKKRAKTRNARDKTDAETGVTYSLVLDTRIREPPSFDGTISCLKLYNPKKKSYIAALVYRQPESAACRTILFSHGNATDIGAMSMMQSLMAKNLGVNVVMYDYSGYGESGGVALEKNTYYDIQTAYKYCVDVLADGKPEKVIIYGQSVGSGPSCYLSTKKPVGGLILHSPFTSGMRVLTPSRALACLDIFPNIDRIKKVKCPVMIIHGQQDEEVAMAHGVALHEAVPDRYKREPWWVPDRGHNDICDGSEKMREYLQRLKTFLTSLDGNPYVNAMAR